MSKNETSFSFCVLAYNHEDFILEHLESIRYQIENYGNNRNVFLILNDDASSDGTRSLISDWLLSYSDVFAGVKRIFNKANIGTAKSVVNIVRSLETENFKLTAADDVYSFENIFDVMCCSRKVAVCSGVPFRIIGGELKGFDFYALSIIATYKVYQSKSLNVRSRCIGAYNAPNALYKYSLIKNPEVMEFLSGFEVVEDWAINVAIAELDKSAVYELEPVVLVYYRRTVSSTYIVANNSFVADQLKMFDHLVSTESKRLNILALKIRRYMFMSDSLFVKRLLNVALWSFALKCVLRIVPISIFSRNMLSKELYRKHKSHYELIKFRAISFSREI